MLQAEVTALPGRLGTAAQIASFAKESQAAFKPDASVRLAMVVSDMAQVTAACAEAAELLKGNDAQARSAHCVIRRGAAASADSIAFLFPGQGSQYVGMGRDLAVAFPDAFDAWQRAVTGLPRDARGQHLGDIVFPKPAFEPDALQAQEARLRATSAAQPALAAASLAQLALLDRLGVHPAAAAGHSFGELVALHAAGVFDADTLLRLARARGLAMEACGSPDDGADHPLGSMLAVAGDAETVREIVGRHGDANLVLANDNHPKQAVLSGPAESLKKIEKALAAAGLGFQPLKVAAAFHSPLVAPAADSFASDVRKCAVATPRLPVIANSTAAPYPSKPEAIKAQLSGQLAEPVRFRESVEALYARGCRIFLEVGAGSVLTGLAGKCLASRPHVAVALDTAGRHGLRSWWSALAELATLGLPLRFEQLHASFGETLPSAAPPKGPAVVQVGGANLGKPYPPPASSVSSARPVAAATAPVSPVAAASTRPAASVSAAVPSRAPASTAPVASAPVAPARQPGAQLPISKDRTTMSDSSLPAVPVVMRSDDMRAQILEAQRLTQQALLESYSMTLRGLGGAAANVAPAALQLAAPQPIQTIALAAAPPPAPVAAAQSAAPRPVLAAAQPAPLRPVPVPMAAPPPAAPVTAPAPTAAPAPVAAPAAIAAPSMVAAAAPTQASAGSVLAIIAEKTGYPVEALASEMDLEADLGIDSIKRVEILAALRERAPSLPELDPARLGALIAFYENRVFAAATLLGINPFDQ
ncbi:MAG TPA: acyltransferase domain-containing protein, partial [Acetobacteraceae bacterium]|nr:acyltransferase domain-containing protein [Acetobacteraceae bacterium]